MASDTADTSSALARIDAALLRTAAIGGLLGGTALFLVMAGYNASKSMGFWSILNACFAAFVYKDAAMSDMEPMKGGMPGETMPGGNMGGHSGSMEMMNSPIVASHIVVGSLLHLAMSIAAGIAFALVLAVLIRAVPPLGKALATPIGYVLAAAAGGAILFAIMMYAVAPALNREIVDFTPRGPFFAAHLLFGAVVGAWVYWRTAAKAHGSHAGLEHTRLGTA